MQRARCQATSVFAVNSGLAGRSNCERWTQLIADVLSASAMMLWGSASSWQSSSTTRVEIARARNSSKLFTPLWCWRMDKDGMRKRQAHPDERAKPPSPSGQELDQQILDGKRMTKLLREIPSLAALRNDLHRIKSSNSAFCNKRYLQHNKKIMEECSDSDGYDADKDGPLITTF